MATSKDYKGIAKAIKFTVDMARMFGGKNAQQTLLTAATIAQSCAKYFKSDNPKFDPKKFYAACNFSTATPAKSKGA